MARGKSKKKRPIWVRILLGASVFLVVSAIAVAATLVLHYRSYVAKPVLADDADVTVVIPKGTSWPEVVRILEERGVVKRSLYFDVWARRRGLPESVRAGTYHLSGPLQLDALARALREGGAVEELHVTLPEGWTIFHIADRLSKVGLVGREEFLEAARDRSALEEAGIDAESFEGYLFPDTYRFRQGTSAADIVQRLHARWQEVWGEVTAEHAEGMAALKKQYHFDTHAFVTLASLVEKETSVDSERDMIARVFLNRLDRSMRLQTDPTCVYGEETYRDVPEPETCKDPLNRYSTYVIDGLPPGPIANPGRASLEAALDPDDSPNAKQYLFFVARRDGTRKHHFSKSFEEHRRAIGRHLK